MKTIVYDLEETNLEKSISQSLLHHLYEGIYFVDSERQIKFWNNGAEKLTGYKAEEILGKHCYDNILCHKNEEGIELCKNFCPLVKAMREDSYEDARVYLKHKDGSRIPVWVHVSPMKNSSGKIIGAVEIFVDDSDYDEIKNLNKKLAEVNELKNSFLGVAAHDLRNPLGCIIGFSGILLSDTIGLSDEQKEYLEIISRTSSKMLELVNELLDISVIESGKFKMNLKEASLKDLLKEKVHLCRPIASQKNIVIVENYNSDMKSIFDYDKIGQAVDNLITNALKFSYANSKIYITLNQEDDYLCVSIKDEGVGIPEKDLDKLFKGLQNIRSKPTAGEKSTGLGLAIVKKIIESHNGVIEAESIKDKGSTFTFKLPVKTLVNA